jgi:hypothetical protein
MSARKGSSRDIFELVSGETMRFGLQDMQERLMFTRSYSLKWMGLVGTCCVHDQVQLRIRELLVSTRICVINHALPLANG